jgi:penicillin-binding protein 2
MLKADNLVSFKQYFFVVLVTWCLILILILRYFQLQILGYDQYSKKANTNRIRKVTLSAPRGLILDRNRQILVDNLPTYILNTIPGELRNKSKTFKSIYKTIGLDTVLVENNYKKYYRGKFIPTRLAKDLSFSQISKLEENKTDLKGLYYQQFPERYFPSKTRSSHILGYVKEVDREIRSALNQRDDYELGDIIGWSGLEKSYEDFLKGNRGIQFYQVDAFGREAGHITDLNPIPPEPGQNILTTIDVSIQKIIEQLMSGKKGVVLVGIPETGEILGAVSAPDFKPDLFTGRISENDWKAVINDPDKPLVNRYNTGLYPPGSIMKMITELALLQNPEFDSEKQYNCSGSYQFGDRVFGCWKIEGHGDVNLTNAISKSCDIYFYKTINYYDLNVLSKLFLSFGFGQPVGIDIEGEVKGLIPTVDYMNKRYGKSGWSKGALLNFCIGQGEILVTPMQVFNYVNILATKGKSFRPHFVKLNTLIDNKTVNVDEKHWNRIISDMEEVVMNSNGTGKSANPGINGIRVFGKTGTAENPHGNDHAWFIGWMENNDDKYSVVVLHENGGSGGSIAAPIAKNIFLELNNLRAIYNQI